MKGEFDPLEFQQEKNAWTLAGLLVGVIVGPLLAWWITR